MHTDKLTTKCHICLHTWKQGGLMCGIWDWQSTIVKDLNDSQDPKHTLFCREIVFVAIYALFSDNKCPLFIVWKGSWFWLFTHFGAIKSPRRSRGLFIAPKCVKSQNQLPLHSKMLNSSDCCEGSVLTEDIWIISEKWNFKCMPVHNAHIVK